MKSNTSTKGIGAGLLVAFTASLCCITPVFALLAGVGGIAATFSWLEPFRPYLIVLTIGVLGFAWYQKLKPRTKEEIECACEEDEKPSFWQSKRFLGIVTVFAALMLTFPSYSHIFYPDVEAKAPVELNSVKLANFDIKGMTCTGCEEHVKHAVLQLPGVLEAASSYKTGTAQVKFESSMLSIEKITEAINGTGYTVIKSEEKEATKTAATTDR